MIFALKLVFAICAVLWVLGGGISALGWWVRT